MDQVQGVGNLDVRQGDGSGVGGTIEGVGNKRVAGTTGSRASANGDDWGEVESVGTCV